MGSNVASSDCSAFYNITEETVSEWLFTPADSIIITVIIPIILALGLINNFTFLFVIFRSPKLRSETNIYLAHLAMADLLYLILSVFHDIVMYKTGPTIRGSVIRGTFLMSSAECICFVIVANTGYFASIVFLTMVSFERYLAMCHPIKHLKIRGRRRTNKTVAICWLVGLIFSGITVPGSAKHVIKCLQWPDDEMYHGFQSTVASCGAVQPWVIYYTTPLLNVPWLIALVANIYMFVKIIQTLHKRKSALRKTQRYNEAVHTRNQVAKMLIVNGVVFFICQTPYRVISLTAWVSLLAQIPDPLRGLGLAKVWVSLIPQYVNTVVNPLIYGVMSSQYRSALIDAFQRKRRSRNKEVSATISSNVINEPETDMRLSNTFKDNEKVESRL
ncbi:kappa-type opioid receptor-like [Asterias amurensis]|uniref:kappa-type opioid receptor-like n=1 Tax=Asterias amurensis TaxID=7602 RepID=UPI003AB2A518